MNNATTIGRKMLLETLAGHFAWLQEAHPRKAASAKVQRTRRYVQGQLRACDTTQASRRRNAA